MRFRKILAPVAVVVAVGAVAAGCGESQETAERALCADISSLRASMQNLAQTAPLTSPEQFREARENVRESWRQVQDSAANAGADHFDEMSDAWNKIGDTLDDIDDAAGLRDARSKLLTSVTEFDRAKQDLVDSLNCSDTDQ